MKKSHPNKHLVGLQEESDTGITEQTVKHIYFDSPSGKKLVSTKYLCCDCFQWKYKHQLQLTTCGTQICKVCAAQY